jgi:outer membrane protein W
VKFLQKLILILLFFTGAKVTVSAQQIALSSNLLEDAILTPNLGVDIAVADRQSVSFDASYAPYKISSGFHNKCMSIRAGYKFWLNQSFYSHYVGIDAVLTSSDFALSQLKSRSEQIGLGLSYGYSFILGKRINLVPHVGVGLAYTTSYDGYDHMIDTGTGVQATSTSAIKPIITRLGVTIQYVLK